MLNQKALITLGLISLFLLPFSLRGAQKAMISSKDGQNIERQVDRNVKNDIPVPKGKFKPDRRKKRGESNRRDSVERLAKRVKNLGTLALVFFWLIPVSLVFILLTFSNSKKLKQLFKANPNNSHEAASRYEAKGRRRAKLAIILAIPVLILGITFSLSAY